jgi:hypothetical protein
MGRLTVRLPDTLHQQLRQIAEDENISMNQYIVYALTRQVTLAYTVKPVPETELREQRAAYTALLQSLGRASFDEISEVLQERDEVTAERTLSPEVVQKLREKLAQSAPVETS